MKQPKNWESDRNLANLAALRARQAMAQQFTASMFSAEARTEMAQQLTMLTFSEAPHSYLSRYFQSLSVALCPRVRT